MLIEQIIEFELRGSAGPCGRTCTPKTGYFQCWAPIFLVLGKIFFKSAVSNRISIFLIRNRKSAIARLKA